ncbi:WecB/TagA/CpsF family glycosyltransferase [Rhodococcus sp. IEGM 1343]|uniref:WecB/TagA/CpsF family glycosyltransferase n=1 Tax=Rhodococcus sp. IEGM 1343 TaxID=3082224 RepID=UPI002952D8F0|nr:WecB/TagA/CpsF family glycosyltransferase [Rhodococcus sp. IEGM 1343]MDV8055981.1 WecB/TagA/CpsF family glycosyltransferase [Rhodococcus sp. IEGM 1343]
MSRKGRSESMFPTSYVGTVPFASTDLNGAASFVIDSAQKQVSIPIRLSNAYCVALAGNDGNYSRLLNGRGVNFPDGTPVVWFMRWRAADGHHAKRVRGPSLFGEVLSKGRESSLSHFFLGTDSDTLSKLVQNVSSQYPGVKISGTYDPPFGPVTESFIEECVKKIENTDAQIVWVALGTPKQDYVAARLADRTARPCLGVGAAFDFHAGTVREAPEWIQRSGMEWVYRLSQDPRRLWKRYLVGNFQFLYHATVKSVRSR